MKSFFLSAVSTIVFYVVVPGMSARMECSNPPPGLQKIVRGVDVTKVDMVPIQLAGSNGFMSPVLSFTCNDNRTWRNPSGSVYQLPDQVWHMTTNPSGLVSAEADLIKTSQDIRRSKTSEVGVEGSLWKFAFSASANYMKFQNTITNSSRYISVVSAFESSTRVDFIPSWVLELDRFAAMFIDRRISGTFESNPSAYERFIQNFGTHYLATAQFGGYIRVTYETSLSYFYSKSDTEVKNNAKASFLNFISARGGHVTGSTTVDTQFRASSIETARYYGGNTNLLSGSDGIIRWQPTVNSDPWPYAGILNPISDLITDETKRTSMVQAVKNYVMKSHIDELDRLVNTAKSKFNSPVLDSLQHRINTQKSRTILVESEVDTLSHDVNHQIVVAQWFLANTELCYKWRADGDGGQCGGGAANLLCAKPNLMTPVYRDDTDRRSGGCRMQWGIQSNGFPSWFSEVRICYRWYADGNGGQCGGGAANLLCANINGYSPEYRDDSDRRSGGCQMSWSLQVPDSAPLWMKTTKMCFSWYPDGDGGQCTASSRDLCAVANQWTEYYRDDTDSRNGGCRMSWGFKLQL